MGVPRELATVSSEGRGLQLPGRKLVEKASGLPLKKKTKFFRRPKSRFLPPAAAVLPALAARRGGWPAWALAASNALESHHRTA